MTRAKIILFLLILTLGFGSIVYAASNGSIQFTGTGYTGAEICDDAELDYTFSLTADTDDGGGVDYFAIVMVDANGSPLDVDFWYASLGAVNSSDYTDLGLINSVAARPVTIAIFDIGDPSLFNENSVEGFNFAVAGTLLAQDYFDPNEVTSTCSELPLQDPYIFGGGSVDTCLVLPDGSVMGDLPFATQAFYAPDKVAPGVTINAGTYWVVGQDESGQYYKIMLSCQFLWVPVGNVQPSFQPPWSGQPLPTRVVS